MVEYDREYFQDAMKGLPTRAQAVIALRAALRVVPVLKPTGAHDWLACFRCLQTAAFANSTRSADRIAAAAAARASVAGILGSPRLHLPSVLALAGRAAADSRSVEGDASGACAYAVFFMSLRTPAGETVATQDAAAASAFAATILDDIAALERNRRHILARLIDRASPRRRSGVELLGTPLWPPGLPAEMGMLWQKLRSDLESWHEGFEIWIDWYQDRLDGKPFDLTIERDWALFAHGWTILRNDPEWTLLDQSRLDQSPAEVNAYLKVLRDRNSATQPATNA